MLSWVLIIAIVVFVVVVVSIVVSYLNLVDISWGLQRIRLAERVKMVTFFDLI
jgi:hypothetical protein